MARAFVIILSMLLVLLLTFLISANSARADQWYWSMRIGSEAYGLVLSSLEYFGTEAECIEDAEEFAFWREVNAPESGVEWGCHLSGSEPGVP